MEAATYLADGFFLRKRLEAQRKGWQRLGALARVWQPSRLMGIIVQSEFGTPFLAATQVFDVRPSPRKWLALERTQDARARFVEPGMILVTCSGAVGRATLAHQPHRGTLISHDLLRVEPLSSAVWGWLYAFLRTKEARAIMVAAQYGHMIKHLETAHLDAIPVPRPLDQLLERFNGGAREILSLRNAADDLVREAETTYAGQFPAVDHRGHSEDGFVSFVSSLDTRRRRLDAACHHPHVRAIRETLAANGRLVSTLGAVVKRVFVPGRFKHVYGEGGVPYLDSADILEVCPDITKHVLSLDAGARAEYLVEPGWLLLPCSGQVYGNIGQVVLATEWHAGKVLSNHVLRVVPKEPSDIRSGYLQCVLGHPTLGRPIAVSFAFGSSVPELSPDDIAGVPVPRLGVAVETAIAERMEKAAEQRAQADILEMSLAADASAIVRRVIMGDLSELEGGLSMLPKEDEADKEPHGGHLQKPVKPPSEDFDTNLDALLAVPHKPRKRSRR